MRHLHRRPHRRHRGRDIRSGAATVEFALVASIAFMFIFETIEFSRAIMVKHAVASAARDAAREAALATTQSSDAVVGSATNFLASTVRGAGGPEVLRVRVSPSDLANAQTGTPITVRIDLNFNSVSLLPVNVSRFLTGTIISGQATRYRE